MSKKKNHILTLEEEFEDFETIGICSQYPEYRFIWAVNEKLETKFIQQDEPYITYNKKGTRIAEFTVYSYTHPIDRVSFYLIKNNIEGARLIEEKSTIDYFLFIYENHTIDLSEYLANVKNVESVLGAYIFDIDNLPSLENITLQ